MRTDLLPLSGKTIVLGITGGIAAYKACDVVSKLVKQGAGVHVIMTHSACEFVRPLSLQTLSMNPVAVDTFEAPVAWEVEHISLAKKADLLLIAPATANVIAKLALGLADDMLTTTALACKAPLLIAPAMNTVMWMHPATQENLQVLKDRGAATIGPEGGMLACGDVGAGRMSEPQDIVAACVKLLTQKQDYQGIRVLVTAGPTREKLDPVRFITNRSSGKMGYAIAKAAISRGAQVTLVSGPVNLPVPDQAQLYRVESTQDLYDSLAKLAKEQDIVIQAAAPADFRPLAVSQQKMKKQGDGGLSLQLEQTPDVAKAIGSAKRSDQVFVGFAAETEELMKNAKQKLVKKNLDLIALNDVSEAGSGFDVDTNRMTLINPLGEMALPMLSKQEAADRLLDEALRVYQTKRYA